MIDDLEFQAAFRDAIDHIARPLFTQAVDKAEALGVLCTLEDAGNVQGYPSLCLRVSPKDPALHSSYILKADAAKRTVVHEHIYNDGQELKTLDASIESINRTVIETELAAFFEKTAQLKFVLDPHLVGF